MTLESIFAHIFYNVQNLFTLKLSYIEINNETIYDLLDHGKQVENFSCIRSEICSEIDEALQLKT